MPHPLAGVTCLAAGVVVPLVCQAVPPLHTLQHEFTTLFTAILALLLFGSSLSTARRTPRRLAALGVSLLLALTCALLGFATMWVANALGPRCELARGISFYWVTLPPTFVFACVTGTILGASRLRWKGVLLCLTLAVGLDAAHDVAQLVWGPRVIPVDFFLGDLLAFNQRAAAGFTTLHLFQRGFLVVACFVLWGVVTAWIDRSRPAGIRAAVGSGLLAVVCVTAGPYVGVGWSLARLHEKLPIARTTTHFVIRATNDPATLSRVDAIARGLEWSWQRLDRLWSIDPRRQVRVYIYPDRNHKLEWTAIRAGHAKIRQIHIRADSPQTTLLHELVHALHIELQPSPRVLLYRGMLEGTAMAFGNDFAELPQVHDLQAGALESGKLPSASSIMSIAGFSSNHEWAAYQSAGSFLGFLVLQYGMEPFLTLQKTVDFETSYGKSITTLDGEWRTFLESVPVDPARTLSASRLFDDEVFTAYTRQTCPKSRPREDPGDRSLGALRRSLTRDGDLHGAVEVVDRQLRLPALKDFETHALLSSKIRLLARLKRWDALESVFRHRRGLGPIATGETMLERCLTDPEMRDSVSETLETQDSSRRRELLDDLARRHPDSLPVLYLRLVWGLTGESFDARIRATLDLLTTAPEACERVGRTVAGLIDEAFDDGAYAAAGTLCTTILDGCKDERVRHLAQLGVDRLAFESPGSERLDPRDQP